jgi:hypothetical protein
MALTVYEEQLIHKSTTGAWRHVVALWGMLWGNGMVAAVKQHLLTQV